MFFEIIGVVLHFLFVLYSMHYIIKNPIWDVWSNRSVGLNWISILLLFGCMVCVLSLMTLMASMTGN